MEIGSARDFIAVKSGTRSGLVSGVEVSGIWVLDGRALTSHNEPLRGRDHRRRMPAGQQAAQRATQVVVFKRWLGPCPETRSYLGDVQQ